MGDKPDTPEILYHYCSNAAFLSIIESGTIRLSDLSLSNDSQEGRWVKKIINDSLKPSGIETDIPMRYLDEIIDKTRALGFCVSGDHDSLSQWRACADNASGVAIGLSAEYLKLSSRPNLGFRHHMAGFDRVRYKLDERQQLILGLIEEISSITAEN
ncbi:hypothetical protein H261_07021 [Paramagnetospirillum caucaseum]|uniref:Uncharacterized protein n=1 Tax=Paramagnetospirillum caucaseum TaxID=1244869 RepID=M3ACZ8_9PROT|nr:DUF2971 domain-containing protein [Paramagnetospirillum caucaseum]EME70638.1 hypothetical protein H261_07021 [Paramagnetospirillum caucaseum]